MAHAVPENEGNGEGKERRPPGFGGTIFLHQGAHVTVLDARGQADRAGGELMARAAAAVADGATEPPPHLLAGDGFAVGVTRGAAEVLGAPAPAGGAGRGAERDRVVAHAGTAQLDLVA